MPAEWESHAATWLSWPYNPSTWEGHLEGAEEAFTAMIGALLQHEHVHLLTPGKEVHERALKKLNSAKVDTSNLTMHTIESGDVWIRDYGPIFIVRGAGPATSFVNKPWLAMSLASDVAWTKWIYNAYGNKYDDLLVGNEVPDKMPLQRFTRFDAGIVLEGGSVDVNGSGTLLTTESCLLSPDRNPGLTREHIEHYLREFLGVTNILWLKEGIAGDDTTGHVDALTRFVGRDTVVTIVENDRNDPNHAPLQENFERLQSMTIEDGTPLKVVPLPVPKALYIEGRRMAATYANFYIANGVVLVPIFAQTSDEVTLKTLQEFFPARRVIGIDSRELIWGYGSIHCATQQQPHH
jgi:agmatine deiminase